MSVPFPQFETVRLIMRRPNRADVPAITELLQDREVANNTLTIPYPYTEAHALGYMDYIEGQPGEENPGYNLALIRREDGAFLGICGIHVNDRHNLAELGYWIGQPYRGQNYTTEAIQRLIQFGFEALGLNRIMAQCFIPNVGSARVMEKCGMIREGLLRQAVKHNLSGEYRDVYLYSILCSEFMAGQGC